MSDRSLYSMRSLILSQCRDLKMVVTWEHLWALTTVLNLLEAVYLRFRKIVLERVTVVKFRVDNWGSNGTGCFRIKVRTDAAEPTNTRIAELRKWWRCDNIIITSSITMRFKLLIFYIILFPVNMPNVKNIRKVNKSDRVVLFPVGHNSKWRPSWKLQKR